MSDDSEEYYTRGRQRMVDEQIVTRGVYEPRLYQALVEIPRHLFVPEEQRHYAYTDGPLPIGEGQTISQPYIVALMTDLLSLTGVEKVLEVGTGSGYQAAILGRLAQQVHTIERHATLAKQAERLLLQLGLANVQVHVGDGSLGLEQFAPFQAIIVTAAAPRVPTPLLNQLEQGGRLVIPVGRMGMQNLERWVRSPAGYEHDEITPVAFVPLRGKYGWDEDRWGIS